MGAWPQNLLFMCIEVSQFEASKNRVRFLHFSGLFMWERRAELFCHLIPAHVCFLLGVVVCRQHELPPEKSRSVAVQTRGCGRDADARRLPGSAGCRRGRPAPPAGCAGLPLRHEPQGQYVHKETRVWHHQEPLPEQGELCPLTVERTIIY